CPRTVLNCKDGMAVRPQRGDPAHEAAGDHYPARRCSARSAQQPTVPVIVFLDQRKPGRIRPRPGCVSPNRQRHRLSRTERCGARIALGSRPIQSLGAGIAVRRVPTFPFTRRSTCNSSSQPREGRAMRSIVVASWTVLSIFAAAEPALAADPFLLVTGRRDPRIYAIDFKAALRT